MDIMIRGNDLVVSLSRGQKVWAVHGNLRIPLVHISRIHCDRPPTLYWAFRCPGSMLPGIIKAGTYYTRRGKEFWYWRRGKQFLTIELTEHSFARLVFGVEDAASTMQDLQRALLSPRSKSKHA